MYLDYKSKVTLKLLSVPKKIKEKNQKHDPKPNFPNIRVKVIISAILKEIKYSYKTHKKN